MASTLVAGLELAQFRLLVSAPDPGILELRQAWFGAPDLDAQRRVAKQLQLLVLERPPFLPLGEFAPLAGLRSNVVDIAPAAQTVFWGARKS